MGGWVGGWVGELFINPTACFFSSTHPPTHPPTPRTVVPFVQAPVHLDWDVGVVAPVQHEPERFGGSFEEGGVPDLGGWMGGWVGG